AAVKGEGDADFQKMTAYIAELRKQADSVASQLSALGVSGPSMVPRSTTPLGGGTEGYVKQWWELLDKLEASLSGTDAGAMARWYDTAETHRKGWMTQHSAYATILARQETLHGKITLKQIDAAIAEAQKMADKGKKEKNAQFFGPNGGPAQQLGFAKKHLAAFVAVKGAADPEAVRLAKVIDDADRRITTIGNAVIAELLATRRVPAETYAGGDKASLRSQVIAQWKSKYPQDQILGIRFHNPTWTRVNKWEYANSAATKRDFSWLSVKIITRKNDQVATVNAAVIRKEHLSGNRIYIDPQRNDVGDVSDDVLMKYVK
ncbi:MAG: hypothetical protein H7338_08175, partial [Candidatus Sericytochromatia bacterium]|nr:hypothetical protein [Candidatus Sericytochromatia bacterium]